MGQTKQTDKEFFQVEKTGRAGLEQALVGMHQELASLAAPNVRKSMDVWQQRAIAYVANQQPLMAVMQSRQGLFSIYKALAHAAQMGLQPGGNYPHFHLVSFQGRIVLVVTAEGLAFASVHGPGAVLTRVPRVVEVYEKDELSIDHVNGTYTHQYDPRLDRGDLSGYLTRLEYKDGHSEVPYVSSSDVRAIAQNYSKMDNPAWKRSGNEMFMKIAAKKLFRKPAAESEALAALFAADMVGEDAQPVVRDVTGPIVEPEPIDVTPEPVEIDESEPTMEGSDVPDAGPETVTAASTDNDLF